jgi:hypothetical protein
MKQYLNYKYLVLVVLLTLFYLNDCFVHIELKKSTAKYKSEYLKSLKFQQLNIINPSSFLEEKDISLHQQVYINYNI